MRTVLALFGVALVVLASWRLCWNRYVPEVTGTAGDDSPPTITAGQSASTWAGWRGSMGRGHAAGNPLLNWSESQGVLWKVPVPGRGYSSPIVSESHVYLTTSTDEDESQTLLCFHAENGDLLWRHSFLQGGFVRCHPKNCHASATCACDADGVYAVGASHGEVHLTAIDHQGKRIWQVVVGPYVSQHGYASSVVLHRDLILVAGENKGARLAGATSYLAAFRKQDGRLAWRVARPLAPSYGTPIVAQVAGRWQALLAGAEALTAHDPETGHLLWEYRWERGRSASSVAFGDGIVFASRTIPSQRVVAVHASGEGDVSESGLVWDTRKNAPDVPSPLWHDGRLYLLTDQGFASCLEASSGRVLWQRRLTGPFSASPILAGGRLYLSSENGETFVLDAGPTYRLLARNRLDGEIRASLAVNGDRLYLRTNRCLYALGESTRSVAGGSGALQPRGKP